MRLPLTKVYRAFAEFDGVSTEQCERLLRRVRANGHWLMLLTPLGAMVAATGWIIGLLAVVGSLERQPAGWLLDDPSAVLAVGIIGATLFGAVGFLLVRDYALLLAMRREVRLVRCRKCKQSMLGLPVQTNSIGKHTPGDAWVRCPECGTRWDLLAIGLTPRDLIPFEQREVDDRVAQPGGDWFGKANRL